VESDPIPKIELVIKNKFFHKLLNKRNEAVKLGVLLSSDDDFVPAKIKYKNKNEKYFNKRFNRSVFLADINQ